MQLTNRSTAELRRWMIGLEMIFGYFAVMQTDVAAGAAMWLAAIIMFVSGHKI